jgi:arylsulfate sulfotransferase
VVEVVRALLLVGLLGGCPRDPEPPPVVPVDMVSGPVVTDNPAAGLTAWLDVSLSEPRELRIEVAHPARTFTVESPAATDHHVLLLGLRADAAHELTVRAVDDEGRTAAEQTLTYTTPPLPLDFFLWDMGVAVPERMELGATLVGFGNYLVMIDPQGAPVWYVFIQGAIHEANQLANGNLAVLVNRTMIHELALDGTLLSSWRAARNEEVPAGATAVDIEACHHDVIELPNGNLASLSIERRWVEGYPSSEFDPDAPPEAAWVAGDVVVEWTREGEVVGQWPLLDLLAPTRIGYDAVIGDFWEDFGPWVGEDIKDWSHGNAISYDPETDTLLVGMRHQDAVIGFSRATGELSWILAPEANWPAELQDKVLRPAGPSDIVPYHMHGAKFTPDGHVLLFDNGNNRASPYEPPLPDPENFSRALEVELDLQAGTWSTVFEYGRELQPTHYAGSLGDADPLPATGNVFITFGNIANPELGGVRLLEVTREGEIVWDLVAPYAAATTQRAQRVTGLLPGL